MNVSSLQLKNKAIKLFFLNVEVYPAKMVCEYSVIFFEKGHICTHQNTHQAYPVTIFPNNDICILYIFLQYDEFVIKFDSFSLQFTTHTKQFNNINTGKRILTYSEGVVIREKC